MENRKPILVIDDNFDFGELIAIALSRSGYTVEFYPRAELQGEVVQLMDEKGVLTALDANRYLIALVDGRIKGGDVHGWDLTPAMVKAGVKVVAISGHPGFNDQMLEMGAFYAVPKHDLFCAIVDGKLDLNKLAQTGKS